MVILKVLFKKKQSQSTETSKFWSVETFDASQRSIKIDPTMIAGTIQPDYGVVQPLRMSTANENNHAISHKGQRFYCMQQKQCTTPYSTLAEQDILLHA
jgi:hypothetical protein